MKYML